MRILFASFSIVIAFACFGSAATVNAHEFETNHIERSIDVVVRDQNVEVKYSFGLADSTIVDWLSREQLIDAAEEARFRKCIAELENAAEEVAETDKGSRGNSGEPAIETANSDGSNLVKSASPDAERKPGKKAVAKASPEPLKFQTELLELLKEKLSGTVVKNLELSSNDETLSYSEIVVSNSARHHVTLEILLKASLPDAEKNKLEFVDRNFLDSVAIAKSSSSQSDTNVEDSNSQEFRYFGNIRLACRSRGKAVQLKSNVAPVIARAKSTSLQTLDRDQRLEAATILTNIVFAKTDQD